MAIVTRNQGRKWEKTEKVIFADGAQLQKRLYTVARAYSNKDGGSSSQTSPERLGYPAAALRTWLVWMHKENVLIVETKLVRDGEIRRKAIGLLRVNRICHQLGFRHLPRILLLP